MRGMRLLVVFGIAFAPGDAAAEDRKPITATDPPIIAPLNAPGYVEPVTWIGFDFFHGSVSAGLAQGFWCYEAEEERIGGIISNLHSLQGSEILVGVIAEKYLGNGFAASCGLECGVSPRFPLTARGGLSWYPMQSCELKLGYELGKGLILSLKCRL
jgi:hypothetical protein